MISTDATAAALWADYEKARVIQPEQKTEAVAIGGNDPVFVFDRCVGVHQGHKSKIGRIMNDAVAARYSELFAPWSLEVERKVRIGGKRDIDVLLAFAKADLYVSVTTIPQERKDETWPNEFRMVDDYRRNFGYGRKPFRFLGLFCTASSKLDLAASIRQRERKQELMPQGVTVVCLQDQTHHSKVLSEILGTMI